MDCFFFFNDTATTEIYTLSLHDALPIFPETEQPGVDLILPDFSYLRDRLDDVEALVLTHGHEDHIGAVPFLLRERADIPLIGTRLTRSEEHTSELQSRQYLVCRLLLEKKKKRRARAVLRLRHH